MHGTCRWRPGWEAPDVKEKEGALIEDEMEGTSKASQSYVGLCNSLSNCAFIKTLSASWGPGTRLGAWETTWSFLHCKQQSHEQKKWWHIISAGAKFTEDTNPKPRALNSIIRGGWRKVGFLQNPVLCHQIKNNVNDCSGFCFQQSYSSCTPLFLLHWVFFPLLPGPKSQVMNLYSQSSLSSPVKGYLFRAQLFNAT